jgi:hypothetical protein
MITTADGGLRFAMPSNTAPELELPPKPIPPEPGDCCGGGCAQCVFDIYDRELERWEQQVAEILKQREPGDAKDRHP